MKKAPLTLVLLGVFGISFSQTTDSLATSNSSLLRNYENSLSLNPVLSLDLPFRDFTRSELSFSSSERSLRPAQSAGKVLDLGFKTLGLITLSEKFRAEGSVGYNYVEERDVAFNLSANRPETTDLFSPHYLFVPKAGDFKHQQYHIRGSLLYKSGNLSLGTKARYESKSSVRTLDPRPEIITADYGADLYGAYQIKEHQFSLGAGLSKETQNHDIENVNQYINSPSNPEYFVRFSTGYGRVTNFPSFREFLYRTKEEKLFAGYRYRKNNTVLSVNYENLWSMENIYTQSAQGNVYIDPSLVDMKFRVKGHKLDLNTSWNSPSHRYLAGARVQSLTGDNFSRSMEGQNYRSEKDQAEVFFQSLPTLRDAFLEGFRIEALGTLERARDLLGVTDQKIQSVTLGAEVLKSIYRSAENHLTLSLGARQHFPLSTSLEFSNASSSSSFYEGVLLPNYHYQNLYRTHITTGLSLTTAAFKDSRVEIFSNFAFEIKSGTLKPIAFPYPNRPNLAFALGANLYY